MESFEDLWKTGIPASTQCVLRKGEVKIEARKKEKKRASADESRGDKGQRSIREFRWPEGEIAAVKVGYPSIPAAVLGVAGRYVCL